MRKFTILIAFLAVAGIVNAQTTITGTPTPVKDGQAYGMKSLNEKAGGDVFWETSFDWGTGEDTTSWSIPEGWIIVDNTDFGNPWMWRSPFDNMGGCCTDQGASPNFLTPEDGFIALPADEYNNRDGVSSLNAMDSYFQTPVIDCSDKASVVVSFSQLFRMCCAGTNNLKMYVTNDDGVHWAEYDCLFGLPNNRVTDQRYRDVEFNISDVAAGMANVQIRFQQWGNTHYFWIIDDLRLSEAYQNEVVLEDYWAEINGGFEEPVGHINYMPLSQMGSTSEVAGIVGEYSFNGAMLNNGMLDQENLQLQMTILKNGEQTYQDVSDGSDLWALDRDTLSVNSAFLADDYGDYQMTFEAISDNAEERPSNNSKVIGFTVTDTLYHRADFTPESASNTGGWVGGGNAGDMVGVYFDVYQATEIKAITSYIWTVTDAEAPDFQYVLEKYIPEEDLYVEWIVSDIYPADSTIAHSWQTRTMELDGETEFLEAGEYLACVRFWGDDGTEEGSNGMSIGWDMDNREEGYTYQYQAVSDSRFTTDKVNLIGMVFNESGAPTEAPATFNVDMNAHIANGEFNVGSDFVDVAGSFNDWTGSAQMTDEDGDGIYSISVDVLTIGSKIEYKYRINGSWDTSEFPLGGDNRVYTIRYWNIIDNVYNGGEITNGVNDLDLVETFNVYPNPTIGDITVHVGMSQVGDIAISMMDIQGHVVYQKEISSVISHTELIENNFAKGIYFLTINNGRNVKVQKVIVQ